MSLPYFYVPSLQDKIITLEEDTSKHMISVLRMQKGEEALLTNGRGKKATVIIADDNRKRCTVEVTNLEEGPAPHRNITIAISLIKNSTRFEWFLEKATEIGITQIIPLLCERTEKEKFRADRLQQIMISAMLQSQQSRLPLLHQPTVLKEFIIKESGGQKFIAHCLPDEKIQLSNQLINPSTDGLILIGPEGDFTPAEIESALQHNFQPVALGHTRLRTETAGIVAATLLCQGREGADGFLRSD